MIENRWAKENVFRRMEPDFAELPKFDAVSELLPRPFISGDQTPIDCYWHAWKLAFENLRPATPRNGFVANFIDTAFNNYVFMWDSVFILMFGRYGRRAFDFQRTLDNFYCKQESDGYISRELHNDTGESRWEAFDPVSTGPNLLHWSEFEHWLNYADRKRLEMVFPALLAYHEWTRLNRSWPDGSYWNTGYGCGMDNQPRLEEEDIQMRNAHHGFMGWIDANFQAVYSAKTLLKMGEVLGRKDELRFLEKELSSLEGWINANMWSESEEFYFDRRRDGSLSSHKTIGAFWGIIAEAVPNERLKSLVRHLTDESQFNRFHRVPSIPANDPFYDSAGAYWCGAVWPPTNYMILRGLSKIGEDKLAFEIAKNHLRNVWLAYEKHGTLFENYAPETAEPGLPAKKDFVGWGGLPPIAVFLEYFIGIRPNVPENSILWDIRLTEEHGVENYPFGKDGLLSLKCEKRSSAGEAPKISAKSSIPVKLTVRWGDANESVHLLF